MAILVSFMLWSCGGSGADNSENETVISENNDSESEIRQSGTEDHASFMTDDPGAYEWWNFWAYSNDTGISVNSIFIQGDPWNITYREAVKAYLKNPDELEPPNPADYFLLTLNVKKDGEEIFSNMRNPVNPVIDAEFSSEIAKGRIGSSTFEASESNGVVTYHVHIDAPDTFNNLRLKADIEFVAISPGYNFVNPTLFGNMVGGETHHWDQMLGYAQTQGTVLIEDRDGRVVYQGDFTNGGGYSDHFWGDTLIDQVMEKWHFGHADFDEKGSIVWMWLTPTDPETPPYGRFLRIKRGELAEVINIESIEMDGKQKGMLGLEYYNKVTLNLEGGGTFVSHFEGDRITDMPYQITSDAIVDIDIPGDISITGHPGFMENANLSELDNPIYVLMYKAMPLLPWTP